MGTKLIHKDQKGLTLLELIIGIAITSLIIGGITLSVDQIFTGSTRSSNHMVAVREVQDAGYWVSEYAYMAQNATITGVSGFPVILQWVNFDPSGRHKVVFNLTSSSGGLRGSYYVDSGGGYVLDSARTGKIPVFQFIDSNKTKTNCQVSGGSVFSLPDIGDVFTIIGGAANDTGRITLTGGTISVNKTGSATCQNVSSGWTWNTTATGGTITVTATSANTKGSWTSENRAATAAITVDSDGDATLSSARGLVFTITATVGAGRHIASETRTYKVVPKPVS
jgi:prepilin-type N-terminal cleavage/methylation domain-containing protein